MITAKDLRFDADAMALITEIVRYCDDLAVGLPPELILAVCWGESRFNTFSENHTAIEDSYGAFQMNARVYTSVPGSNWLGLEGAQRSMHARLGEWSGAFNSVGGGPLTKWITWLRDPVTFFYWYWPAAQGCQTPTIDICQDATAVAHVAYVHYLKQLKGTDPPLPVPPDPATVALTDVGRAFMATLEAANKIKGA